MLDLFAGSGALGLEALSRGAARSPSSTTRRPRSAPSRPTSQALDADADVSARPTPCASSAPHRETGAQYDLVFLDPPYRQAERLARPLSEALPAVLAPGAVAVAESDRRAPLALDLPLHDERRYGDTLIRIHGP